MRKSAIQETIVTLLSVVWTFAAPTAFAQEEAGNAYIVRANVRLVNADVTVTSKRTGTAIDNLTQNDFRVLDGGAEQPITHFSKVASDDLPLALVLIVDTSHANKKLVQALADSAERVFQKLKPNDTIAIVKFSPGYSLVQDFTGDVQQTVQALRGLAALAGEQKEKEDVSQLSDAAIQLACNKVLVLANHRRELIAVGQDLNLLPKDRAKATATLLLSSGVSLNGLIRAIPAIGLAKAVIHTSPHTGRQDAVMDYYASESGGVIVSVPAKDFASGLERLLGLVWSQYSIGWRPPDSTSQFHRIQIEVKGRADVKARAKAGYYPLPQKQ